MLYVGQLSNGERYIHEPRCLKISVLEDARHQPGPAALIHPPVVREGERPALAVLGYP